MLNSKRNTYVLTQTDPSYRKLETLCKTKSRHQAAGNKRWKQLGFLTFEPGHWRPDCQKRILFWSKTSKSRTCSGVKLQKFGACFGFLEVKNRPWSVAHTRIPNIRKFSPPGGQYEVRDLPVFMVGTRLEIHVMVEQKSPYPIQKADQKYCRPLWDSSQNSLCPIRWTLHWRHSDATTKPSCVQYGSETTFALLKFSKTIERTIETIAYCLRNNGLLSFASSLNFFQQKARYRTTKGAPGAGRMIFPHVRQSHGNLDFIQL